MEGRQVYVREAVLTAASHVFEEMFREGNLQDIPLPGKSVDTIIELMKVVHRTNENITRKYK